MDYATAYENALAIYNNSDLTIEQIIERLDRIKDSHRSQNFSSLPVDLHHIDERVDRAIVIDVSCLGRLVDVSNEKCVEEEADIRFGNVHKSNYIDLEQSSLQIFLSDMIRQYGNAQSFICNHRLIMNISQTWSEIVKLHPNAIAFKANIIANIPPDVEIEKFTSRQRLDGILETMKQHFNFNYRINNQLDTIRSYNSLFKKACDFYLLRPFDTLMMTYEKLDGLRAKIKKHHLDLIRAYYLCKHSPQSVLDTRSIGNYRVTTRHSLKPATWNDENTGDAAHMEKRKSFRLARERRKDLLKKHKLNRLSRGGIR